MKNRFISFSRKVIVLAITLALLISFQVNQPRPVSAAVYSDASPLSGEMSLLIHSDYPQTEPTPVPEPFQDGASIEPGSASITLIFETVIKWLFGRDLLQIFSDVDLPEDQRRQIEALIGETNLIDLATDFCAQVRTGEFASMANSVRESNKQDDGDSLSPAILMDFFEQLGAFCPAEAMDLTLEPAE